MLNKLQDSDKVVMKYLVENITMRFEGTDTVNKEKREGREKEQEYYSIHC